MTEQNRGFSTDRARKIGERIGIDWDRSRFDVEQFRMGLGVELEHGRSDPETNVSDDDELTTGKIARAHLNEFPDYYTRLAKMEAEAEQYWSARERELNGSPVARGRLSSERAKSPATSQWRRLSAVDERGSGSPQPAPARRLGGAAADGGEHDQAHRGDAGEEVNPSA